MEQCPIGGLDHRAIDRSACGGTDRRTVGLEASSDGDNGVVNGQRRVTHVDLALALERSGPDYRFLGNLVPLLNRVR